MERLGIYLFDEVELLDFAGPLQVFSAARYLDEGLFPVIETVADKSTIEVSKSGIGVNVHRLIHEADPYHLLIIPGGYGTRQVLEDQDALMILQRHIEASQQVISVCTGSLLLAKLGYLCDQRATTHFGALDLLKELDPSIEIDRTKRFHDNGKFIIAEGVSAGIDVSFYLLTKLFGSPLSNAVKKYIEYYPEKT